MRIQTSGVVYDATSPHIYFFLLPTLSPPMTPYTLSLLLGNPPIKKIQEVL